jgi:D-alanine--poly(phosphoribitol) ligase subunit 2
MNTELIEDRIELFIRTQFDVSPADDGFGRTVDLFELGYVDSVGFAELLAFLTEEFGVEVPESELLSDEFLRIDGIASIVGRLANGGPVRPGWDGANGSRGSSLPPAPVDLPGAAAGP